MRTASVVLVVFAAHVFAQDSWTLASPNNKLPGRSSSFAMAYDSAREVVVLYSRGSGNGNQRQTHEWDGTGWTLRTPKTSPPSLYAHAMAYDSHRKVTVLFGNARDTGTWEWDGTDWRLAGTVHINDTRDFAAMAYDEVRRVVVRFGGQRGQPQGKTWTWDGKAWTLAASGGPPARERHAMVWDRLRERVVLIGGALAVGGAANDTWEWDGKTWIERKLQRVAPREYGVSAAYHAGIGRVVFVGGFLTPNDTWTYDGFSWIKHSPSGTRSTNGLSPAVYDAKRNEIVQVQRNSSLPTYNKTYIYRAPTKALAVTRSFGTGCSGVAGVPKLAFSLPPYIGSPTSLDLTSLPQSTFATPFLHIGASNKSWSGITLPWNLAPIGAPKCTLYVGFDLLFLLRNTNGSASLKVTLPFDPSLVGNMAYAQGFVADRTANALGAAISNAVEAKIGQRW